MFKNLFVPVGSFALILSIVSPGESQIPVDAQIRIDNLIEEIIAAENVPALGLAIVKNNGEILYTKGYGFRDIENGSRADDATIFGVGSVSKSFTATVVIKELAKKFPELGESVLDVPIRLLVPSYNFTLGDRYRSESTTFRDLLAHRTCLLPEALGILTGPFENSKEFLYRQRYAPENCPFRTELIYNNVMIQLAADIAAHIANSTFEDMLSKLLNDIVMADSTFIRQSDDHNNMPNRSVPYYQNDGKLYRMNPDLLKPVTVAIGSGGVLSSARDMAKYMQFHLNYGKVGTVQVVPEEVMKWIHRPSNLLSRGLFKSGEVDVIDNTYGYGLCLFLGVYDGWQMAYHGGYIPPYESLMTLVPELNLGIFTTISGPASMQTFTQPDWRARIFDIVQGINRTTSKKTQQFPTGLDFLNIVSHPKTNMKRGGSSLKIEPGDVVGNFGSGQSGQLECSLKMNSSGVLQPYLSYGTWGQAWLNQISNTSFELQWDSDIIQLFEYGLLVPVGSVVIEFYDIDTIRLYLGGAPTETEFIRDLSVDKLPSIPWSPDSCGPTVSSDI